jgi:hypothetical protein
MLAHLLMLNALAGSPVLHEWLHHDADSPDHDCAVVAVLSGEVLIPDLPVVVTAPTLSYLHEYSQEPIDRLIGSSFLECRIWEHAPPVEFRSTSY